MRKRTTGPQILKQSKIKKVNDSSTVSTKSFPIDVKIKKDVVKRMPSEDRIETLTESIKYSPFDYQLYYRRGLLYFNLGKTSDALNDYSHSIKINPQFGKAYYARAELWAALKNKRLALINLEKAIELDASKGEGDLSDPPTF